MRKSEREEINEMTKRIARKKKQLLSCLSGVFPLFGCQSSANLSRGNHFRSVGPWATVHEPALDWLDTYLRSGKRTVGGEGGRRGKGMTAEGRRNKIRDCKGDRGRRGGGRRAYAMRAYVT